MDMLARCDQPRVQSAHQDGLRLDMKALDVYAEQGYLIVRSVFSSDEIAVMSDACDRLAEIAKTFDEPTLHNGTQFVSHREQHSGRHRIDRVVWVGGAEAVFSKLGMDPRLLGFAGQILCRPRVEQLINQVHFKYPGDGVSFEWHQDSRHRRQGTDLWTDLDGKGSFLETITAIDPMTLDNGPLLVIPRSNLKGHIPVKGPEKALPRDAFDPKEAIPVLMNPGDVLLMSPFIIHSSQPNTGDRSRRVFLNGYCIPGANRRMYPGVDAGRSLRVPPDAWRQAVKA